MSDPPTALVLGAHGNLGNALCEALPPSAGASAPPPRTDGDLRDEAAIAALFDRWRPSVVFNAAAYTDVERAESEPELAQAVNACGAEIIARVAAAIGAAVLRYSTDFVFDGELERPYDERDPPAPPGCVRPFEARAGERLWRPSRPATSSSASAAFTDAGGETFPPLSCAACAPARRCGPTGTGPARRPGCERRPASRPRSPGPSTMALATAPPTARRAGPASRSGWRASWAFRRAASRRSPARRYRSRRFVRDAPSSTTAILRAHGLDTLSAWEDALPAYVLEEKYL